MSRSIYIYIYIYIHTPKAAQNPSQIEHIWTRGSTWAI